MKKIISTIIALTFIGSYTLAHGAFSDPFISIQLATSPSNGNCLTTDGTNNVWGACSSTSNPDLIYRTLTATKYYTASSSATDNLSWFFGNGFISTASSTFNAPLFITNLSQGVLYNGRNGLTQTTATTTLTASGVLSLSQPISVLGSVASVISCPTCGTGSVTSITGGTGLSGGTITTSGTFALRSYLATSSAETKGQLSYWTSTNGTPATIGGVATTSLTASGVLSLSQPISVVGSSASALTVTGGSAGQVLGWLNGVPTWTASSSVAAGAGISISAAGAVTTVTNTIAYPFPNNATSTILGLLDGFFTNGASSTISNLFNFTNASGTRMTLSTYLRIPSTTPTTNGELAVQTTQASSSLRFHDGSAQRALYAEKDMTVVLASSTLAYMANGTSTIRLANFLRPTTITRMYCKTSAGTITVQLGDGGASSTPVSCSTTGLDTVLTSNNAYTFREDSLLAASSTSSTFDTVTITATIRPDAD